jgi:lipopolysaccharide export system permease protein
MLFVIGSALSWLGVRHESAIVANHLRGFPDADVTMQNLRPWILAGLLMLPSFAAFLYASCGTLVRWLARQWLICFGMCYGGILSLYLLIDFSSNAGRISEATSSWGFLRFYAVMLPSICNVLLPFGTLLSVLLCMSRVSRSRELVAALQSGRGMMGVLMPIYGAAMLVTLFSLGLNYHWAPQGGGMKNAVLDEIQGKQAKIGSNIVHFHPKGHRMWMVTELPRNYLAGEPLRGVEVTSLNEDGTLNTRLYAERAYWRETQGGWKFTGVVMTTHCKNQAPVFVSPPEPFVQETWTETPANIWKTGAEVRHLGLPDLSDMLGKEAAEEWQRPDMMRYLSQWHFRFSQPAACLVFAMLGIPLAMYVTRRNGTGGIALAVICAILLTLLQSISLALGESGYIPAFVSAWLPTWCFALFGVWLLCRRVAGRQLWPLW